MMIYQIVNIYAINLVEYFIQIKRYVRNMPRGEPWVASFVKMEKNIEKFYIKVLMNFDVKNDKLNV